MLHWKLQARSAGPICGTPGATKMAAAKTTVTCPDCRALLDLGSGPADGPTLAERLARGHREARLRA